MPILISEEQGIGKSTFLAHLLPPFLRETLFSDGVELSAQRKDIGELLLGLAIAENAEVAGFFGKEAERLRAILSSSADHFRASYARTAVKHPRTAVIVGTANDVGGVLPRDASGHRRFLPLVLDDGDPGKVREWCAEWRRQLWAEAFAKARGGAPAYPEAHGVMAEQRETTALVVVRDELVEHALDALERDDLLADGMSIAEIIDMASPSSDPDARRDDEPWRAQVARTNHMVLQQKMAAGLRERGWRKRRPQVEGVRKVRWFHEG